MTGSTGPTGPHVGAGITPWHTDSEAIRLARRAEELGYADFGVSEGWTHDAVVLLAQIAGATFQIGLASTVLSVWSRTPATLAMAAASLERASGGRFALGLGASSPPLVEGLHGLSWERPVARVRSTIVAVRALLGGARLPLHRADVRAKRLGARPKRRIPILLAGLSPASVRLAGEVADHWVPFLWARSRLADGRALLAEGERAAESATATAVTASVPLALGPDEETAATIAARWLVAYLTRMGPFYRKLLSERFGFARQVDALLAANERGGPPRLPAVAEPLASDVTVMGTYEQAPALMGQWLEGGADAISLVLPLGLREGQLREMLEAAAPAVLPTPAGNEL